MHIQWLFHKDATRLNIRLCSFQYFRSNLDKWIHFVRKRNGCVSRFNHYWETFVTRHYSLQKNPFSSDTNRKLWPLDACEFITRAHRFSGRWSQFPEHSWKLTHRNHCYYIIFLWMPSLLQWLLETVYRLSPKWDSTTFLILRGDDANPSIVFCNVEKGKWGVRIKRSSNLWRLESFSISISFIGGRALQMKQLRKRKLP